MVEKPKNSYWSSVCKLFGLTTVFQRDCEAVRGRLKELKKPIHAKYYNHLLSMSIQDLVPSYYNIGQVDTPALVASASDANVIIGEEDFEEEEELAHDNVEDIYHDEEVEVDYDDVAERQVLK